MKISKISAHLMGISCPARSVPLRNWIFVRVETDEGITGVGEATTEYHEHAVVSMIERHFAPLLLGKDPTNVHSAWQQLRRCFWWRGGVVATSAASGIEQALWDITGKVYGQPVYRLLGGAVRERVRLYVRGDLGLKDQFEEVHAALCEGFTAFKWGSGPIMQPFDDQMQAEKAVALYRDLRESAGTSCDLMIDCAGIFSKQSAYRLIEGLRPLRMLFVEEPVNADIPSNLIELRRAFPDVRMAAGERLMTRWGFREWLELGAVDVIQADISHCGGISELLRIASWAEVYNVMIAPHNPYGPVALAANMHACAVMPNFLILEHCRHRPWFDEVQKYGPLVQDGCLYLSQRPGLGIELDWDYVERHPYQQLSLISFRDRDGALPLV